MTGRKLLSKSEIEAVMFARVRPFTRSAVLVTANPTLSLDRELYLRQDTLTTRQRIATWKISGTGVSDAI